MNVLRVRDVMTIGVPVCRDTEAAGAVAARLAGLHPPAEVVVVLDADGQACGWAQAADLAARPGQPVAGVLDEAIPQLPPDLPAADAAQRLRALGLSHAFLMHTWPGQPRPAAVVSLADLEARLEGRPG